MTDLRALKEKIDAATGPDLELDHEIYREFGLRPKSGPFPRIPNYTASIDAALALVERTKPDCVTVAQIITEALNLALRHPDDEIPARLPRAIISSLLSAIISASKL